MLKSNIDKYLFVLLLFVFNYLFWQQLFGINLFLFSSSLVVYQLIKYKGSLQSNSVKIALVCTLVSGIMLLITNSIISILVHLLSFYILLGFIHEQKLMSIYFSLAHVFMNYLSGIKNLIFDFSPNQTKGNSKLNLVFYYLKLSIIPFIVFVFFFVIYFAANEQFAIYVEDFFKQFDGFFNYIFVRVSFERILFNVFAVLLLSGIIYKSNCLKLLNIELSLPDFLTRIKTNKKQNNFPINVLKSEYKAALILLVAMNVLLAIVNYADIQTVWFDFVPSNFLKMKEFVHEGTYLLILSILLSMLIVLFFFRKNLNFYPANNFLKVLAYLWMLQNAVLVYSVYLRNYNFIFLNGLAYKRIGVMVFLTLVLFGLITLIIKIYKRHSVNYLLRINTWFAFLVLTAMTCVDWDLKIAKYNLNHWNKAGIDVDFYFTLSPKVMPLLFENQEKIKEQILANQHFKNTWTHYKNFEKFEKHLKHRKENFLENKKLLTWQSWNYSDSKTIAQLTK